MVLSVMLIALAYLLLRVVIADSDTAERSEDRTRGLSGTGEDTLLVSDESFTISGTMGGRLSPGDSRPLELSMRNLTTFAISVTRVTITLRGVDAPNADPAHPCTVEDFEVRQLAGVPPLDIAAFGTSDLSARLPSDRWPRIGMLDASENQDGCKGATLRLSYDGTANRTAP